MAVAGWVRGGGTMPTGVGLLFLAVGLYCAIRRPELLFGLLLFSSIFPATSAVTIGSLWIMPYYGIALLFVASQYVRHGHQLMGTVFHGKTLLLALGFFGVISAFLFPVLFTGIEVYSSRLGSSDEVFQTFPLILNLGNVAQAGYLTLNIMVVFAAASFRKTAKIWPALTLAFYTLTGTIFTELGCIVAGVEFPYRLIENSPDRTTSITTSISDLTSRLRGTAGEPSYAGLVLVLFFGAYLYRYYSGRGGGWKVLLATVSICLVRSSSAFLASAAVLVIMVGLYPPFRFPSSLRVQRFAKLLPVIAAISVCLLSPTILSLLREAVINKPSTGSYSHRTTMDQHALYLLSHTYGLGVGLGSFRPSSLMASLLGNVGLMGTLLAVLFIVQIVICVPPSKKFVQWAIIAGIIDMVLAIPDLTQPILWCMIAVAVSVTATPEAVRRIELIGPADEFPCDDLKRTQGFAISS